MSTDMDWKETMLVMLGTAAITIPFLCLMKRMTDAVETVAYGGFDYDEEPEGFDPAEPVMGN